MKKLIIAVIFIGVVGFALTFAFGGGITPYLQEQGIGIGHSTPAYRYDLWGYIQNIKNTWMDMSPLELKLPEREWESFSVANWGALGNNLAVMLNYIVVGLNILIYPIRIGFFTIRLVLSLLGIDVINPGQSGLKWLIDLANIMSSSKAQIPYV